MRAGWPRPRIDAAGPSVPRQTRAERRGAARTGQRHGARARARASAPPRARSTSTHTSTTWTLSPMTKSMCAESPRYVSRDGAYRA